MTLKMLSCAVLVLWCINACTGVDVTFSSAEYEVVEGVTATTIVLTRSNTDIAMAETVALTVECPAECPQETAAVLADTSGPLTDVSIPSTMITFAANSATASVPLTIENDDLEEHREYFCLHVTDVDKRGAQYFTRIVIPWSDHCVSQFSIFDEGRDQESLGYFIKHELVSVVSHVGPMDLSLQNNIKLKVKPQGTTEMIDGMVGDGQNLNIFLGNRADINGWKIGQTNVRDDTTNGFKWYGLHLDDTNAAFHTTDQPTPISGQTAAVNDNSWIDNSGLELGTAPTADGGKIVTGSITTTDLVDANSPNEFDLTVGTSGSPVELAKLGGTTMTGTGGSLSVNNLFVTAANDKYASWEICGMEPNRLPTVGVKASGHYQNFEPGMAIDNLIWYTSCFRSEPDADGNWIMIDMGAEFQVSKVVIYPLQYGPDLPLDIMDPTWLNNLKVLVGSCREDKILMNTECVNIGQTAQAPALHSYTHENQEIIIDRTCTPTSIGRYVYLVPEVPTTKIGFCEVRLFGKEVPLDMETKVYFEPGNTAESVIEGGQATVTVTRSGASPTCTYIKYQTDRSLNGDFTQIYPAKDLEITSTTTEINVQTTQDTDCEGDEKFNVYLTGIDGGVLGFSRTTPGSKCQATVTITDDDSIMYALAASPTTDISVPESKGTLNVQVTQSLAEAGSASVTFASNTATSVADFTTSATIVKLTFDGTNAAQTVPVTIVQDECYEGPETFLVDLKALEPACSAKASNTPLTITITEDDSLFDFQTTGLTNGALEMSEGGSAVMVNVLRTGTALQKTVKLVMQPLEADAGDVTFNPTNMMVDFAAGAASSAVTLTAVDDSSAESTEYFRLCLVDDSGASCPNKNIGTNDCILVKINDNEYKYRFLQPTSTSVSEGGQLQLCVERSNAANAPGATININAVPITANSQDYNVPASIIIASGAASGCTTVMITADQLQESTETFRVEITSGQTGVAGTDSIVITITGDSANVGTGGTGTGGTGTGGTGTGGTGTGGTGTGGTNNAGTGTGTGGAGDTGTSTGNADNTDDGLSTGAIAGIVASAVIGVLIVGTVVVIFCALTGVGPFANTGAIPGSLPAGAQQLVSLDNGNAFGVSGGGFF